MKGDRHLAHTPSPRPMLVIAALVLGLGGVAITRATGPGQPPQLRSIPVGTYPWALTVAPRLGRVFVVNLGAPDTVSTPSRPGTVSVLDARSGALVQTTTVGRFPAAVAVDETSGHAFVAAMGATVRGVPAGPGSVGMLDARTGLLLRTVRVGRAPRAITVDPASGHVFVATGSGVTMLSAQTGAVLRAIRLRTPPYMVAVDGRTGHALATLPQSSSVAVLDTRTGAVLRTVAVGRFPVVVAVATRTGRAFVAGSMSVSVLDTRTGTLLRTIAIHSLGWRVVVDEARGHVFVADTFVTTPTATVYMLDARSGAQLRTTTVGRDPQDMSVDGRAGRVFVTTPANGDLVAVLDARTDALLGSIRVSRHPWAVAADGAVGHVFVTSFGPTNSRGQVTGHGVVTVLDTRAALPAHAA